jgi:thiamine kinase-like enzyme
MMLSPNAQYLSFWLSHLTKREISVHKVEKLRIGEKFIFNINDEFLVKQYLREVDIPQYAHEKAVLLALKSAESVPELIHSEPHLLLMQYVPGKPFEFKNLEDIFPVFEQLPLHARLPKAVPYFLFSDAEYNFLKRMNARLAERIKALRKTYSFGDIIHGDLKPANILKTEDGKLHFIDWEYGGAGDRCWDMAMYYSEYLLHIDSWQEVHTMSPITDLDLFLYLNPEVQRTLSIVRRYLGPEYQKFVHFLAVCILGKTIFREKHKSSVIQSSYAYRISSALILDYHV